MSYSIEYSPHKRKIYPGCKKKSVVPRGVIWIACLAFLYFMFTAGPSTLTERWFASLDALAIQLREGTKIGQAVAVYCETILENGIAG